MSGHQGKEGGHNERNNADVRPQFRPTHIGSFIESYTHTIGVDVIACPLHTGRMERKNYYIKCGKMKPLVTRNSNRQWEMCVPDGKQVYWNINDQMGILCPHSRVQSYQYVSVHCCSTRINANSEIYNMYLQYWTMWYSLYFFSIQVLKVINRFDLSFTFFRDHLQWNNFLFRFIMSTMDY